MILMNKRGRQRRPKKMQKAHADVMNAARESQEKLAEMERQHLQFLLEKEKEEFSPAPVQPLSQPSAQSPSRTLPPIRKSDEMDVETERKVDDNTRATCGGSGGGGGEGGDGEEEWSFEKAVAYNSKLRSAREALRTQNSLMEIQEMKKIEEEINNFGDRNPQLYIPSDKPLNPSTFEIPDSWYDLSASDMSNIYVSGPKEEQIKPKSLKKKDIEAQYKKWKRCLVRIRFPNRWELCLEFHPHETPVAIYRALEKYLVDPLPTLDWFLYTAPPMTLLDSKSKKTLIAHRLVPACIVHFGVTEGTTLPEPYLIQTLLESGKERIKEDKGTRDPLPTVKQQPVIKNYTVGANFQTTTAATTATTTAATTTTATTTTTTTTTTSVGRESRTCQDKGVEGGVKLPLWLGKKK
eukprot:TRINITY_DN6616_c0_g2_i2.p1 TRINITY_DN6616_c0_g2~~TRINITY_DN6616_c0_g2_i2.p1  ORF type:complete len:408 (+),score=138.27 TRINITY_DN6616_c0_g2_i2:631-1854(+)